MNENFYFVDSKPDYSKEGDALLFKKLINNKMAYIKLDLEKNNGIEEVVVCWSFHEDRR